MKKKHDLGFYQIFTDGKTCNIYALKCLLAKTKTERQALDWILAVKQDSPLILDSQIKAQEKLTQLFHKAQEEVASFY